MKNDPILTAIEKLSADDPAGLAKALAHKSNLVAAKAARLIGDHLLPNFIPPLSTAFERFLRKDDKGCVALMALARTLVTLDCDDAELFRKGIAHAQMEGTWGGSVDVASELRAVCAMGLANTRDPNKTRDIVNLLADPEFLARAGAARALAALGSDAAAMVLRFKALTGDKEPEALCDCLHALLSIEGPEALPLVERYLHSRDEAKRDAAIHALGESRRDDALQVLKDLYNRSANPELKATILLAIKTGRTEEGMKFVTFIESGSLPE
jgi:HEAT repeat protein